MIQLKPAVAGAELAFALSACAGMSNQWGVVKPEATRPMGYSM